MRSGVLMTGVGGVVTAVAAAGRPALAGLGVVVLLLIGVLCWTVTNRTRTTNLINIIAALRSTPAARPAARQPRRVRNATPRRKSTPGR